MLDSTYHHSSSEPRLQGSPASGAVNMATRVRMHTAMKGLSALHVGTLNWQSNHAPHITCTPAQPQGGFVHLHAAPAAGRPSQDGAPDAGGHLAGRRRLIVAAPSRRTLDSWRRQPHATHCTRWRRPAHHAGGAHYCWHERRLWRQHASLHAVVAWQRGRRARSPGGPGAGAAAHQRRAGRRGPQRRVCSGCGRHPQARQGGDQHSS